MHLRFDLEYDGYPWPGPLGEHQAAFGRAWVGPRALLSILETQLGLAGLNEPDTVRAAALVPDIRATEGFWSGSAAVDPMGVARTLLAWRDALWAAGWRGASVSPRLDDLARLTRAVIPGTPDRLERVAERLRPREVGIEALELIEKRAHHSRPWQAIFDALEAGGTRIVEVLPISARATGDLMSAKSERFTPRGDGTLQLLRPQGPQVAADATAAWIASSGDLRRTLIVAADPLLDLALRRHGLPTTGAAGGALENGLLVLLPLVLQLGWCPPDPMRALELLTLPVSPVPRAIAGRLTTALKRWPAVDSDAWRSALAEGLDKIEDADRRARVGERLAVLLHPTVSGETYPAKEVTRRVGALTRWLQGMLAEAGGDADAGRPFAGGLIQCSNLLRLVNLVRLDALSRPQLQRLVEDATRDVPAAPRLPAQAGLFGVTTPGAVGGVADRVIWWNFSRTAAPRPETLPLTVAERAGLEDAGVTLPDAAQVAIGMNGRWSRPLAFAGSSLLMVCPKYGEDGERQYPHPLWDQIAAGAADPKDLSLVEITEPIAAEPLKRTRHALLTLPQPRRAWQLPEGLTIPERETESPSGAGALVGCPFQWALRYAGDVWPGDTAELPSDERLVGNVAHEIVARLLKGGVTDPEAAAAEAERLFDAEGPRLAATLFMPGFENLKQQSRRATSRSARTLFQYLRDAGLGVVAVEEPFETHALGTRFQGRPDAVVGPPSAVIDLKWDGEAYHRSELKLGAAFQLAAYSHLQRSDGHVPPVAFFIIRSQRMLTSDAAAFPGVAALEGPPPDEVWRAFERSYEAGRAELRAGRLLAPGDLDEKGHLQPRESALVDGEVRLRPPCRFCNFDLLCGHGLPIEPGAGPRDRRPR